MPNQRGITLIVLVITIIVLLILTAVSFLFVLGNNGIIDKAKGSVENTKIETFKEELSIAANRSNE